MVSDDPKRLQAPAADGCIGLTVPEGSDWADGYDAGAAHASGEVLLFLTDRALPMTPQTLTELADWALYDKVAVAAPKILEEERTIREMGVALTEEGPKPMFRGCFADGTTACGKNYWYRDVHAQTTAALPSEGTFTRQPEASGAGKHVGWNRWI